MRMISYTVTATLPTRAIADQYLAWLVDGHAAAVVAAGAVSAQVVELDPASPIQVEATYLFPDQQAFESYVRDRAPALRADGLRRFGDVPGLFFTRRQGSVILRIDPGVVAS